MYAHSLKTWKSAVDDMPLRKTPGVRFQRSSPWPRYKSLHDCGKSGFSGDSKLQNSAAVAACLTSMVFAN